MLIGFDLPTISKQKYTYISKKCLFVLFYFSYFYNDTDSLMMAEL